MKVLISFSPGRGITNILGVIIGIAANFIADVYALVPCGHWEDDEKTHKYLKGLPMVYVDSTKIYKVSVDESQVSNAVGIVVSRFFLERGYIHWAPGMPNMFGVTKVQREVFDANGRRIELTEIPRERRRYLLIYFLFIRFYVGSL